MYVTTMTFQLQDKVLEAYEAFARDEGTTVNGMVNLFLSFGRDIYEQMQNDDRGMVITQKAMQETLRMTRRKYPRS